MCWIKNTYYIPLDEVIPNKDEDIETEINYYQWVPIVLIVQALMFYLPYMVSCLLLIKRNKGERYNHCLAKLYALVSKLNR